MKKLGFLTLAWAFAVTACAHHPSTSGSEDSNRYGVVGKYKDQTQASDSKPKIPHNPYKACPDGTTVADDVDCPQLNPAAGGGGKKPRLPDQTVRPPRRQ